MGMISNISQVFKAYTYMINKGKIDNKFNEKTYKLN